jgi:uncharacterized protein with beta-barrel porin domain
VTTFGWSHTFRALAADGASSLNAVRLGWQHEFADTGRPITAAFAGAPGNSFTVFGAPRRRAMPPSSAFRR